MNVQSNGLMNVTSTHPAPTLQVHTTASATMATLVMRKIAQVDKNSLPNEKIDCYSTKKLFVV